MELLSYENYKSSQNFIIDEDVIETLIIGDILKYGYYVDLDNNMITENEELLQKIKDELFEIRVFKNKTPEQKAEKDIKKRKKEMRTRERAIRGEEKRFKLKKKLDKREAKLLDKQGKLEQKRRGIKSKYKTASKAEGPKAFTYKKKPKLKKKLLVLGVAITATAAAIAAIKKQKTKLQTENNISNEKQILNLNIKENILRNKIKESYYEYKNMEFSEIELSENNINYIEDLIPLMLNTLK